MVKNPLRKRYLRELRQDLGKYAVILLLMILTIGFVSGFLVAAGSMIIAYDEGFEKYNVEYGHFSVSSKLDEDTQDQIKKLGVDLCELGYINAGLTNDTTLRIYRQREEMNLACLMKGSFPEAGDEIAIDRMYADNNKLSIGDSITADGKTFRISGFVALPDYSCLFENNSDSMFDATKFGAAVVSAEAFAEFPEEKVICCYAWRYRTLPVGTKAEKAASDEFKAGLNDIVKLRDYLPRFLNRAIQFTGEDMHGDSTMMKTLLVIIMIILGFVFALTASDTVMKEAGAIGTLRAMGMTRAELVRHYMVMPLIITLIGAVLGNLLGYTVMKKICAGLYYGSYSLPTYVTVWNADAFILTTVWPVVLMLVITLSVLCLKLRNRPLAFLRKELHTGRKRRARRLSPALPIERRFRLRIILQNLPNYMTLFLGVLFANLLLLFGLMMHPLLVHYQEVVKEEMPAAYQYILQIPEDLGTEEGLFGKLLGYASLLDGIRTVNPDAEKFSAYELTATDGPFEDEEILFYGVEPGSRYAPADPQEGDILISQAYAEKFGIGKGDEIHLHELYDDTAYSFTVTGIAPGSTLLCVYMRREDLNSTFKLGAGSFAGYFSSTPLDDLDERFIGNVTDFEALTKISRQLETSMGSMMYLVDGFAVLIFVVLIYLLGKIILEKNAGSISMVKILGYTDQEIRRLYIRSTTLVYLVSLVLSLPLECVFIRILWVKMLSERMSGWLPYWVDPMVYGKMLLLGVICYAAVSAVEMKKIRKIPMDLALKDVL